MATDFDCRSSHLLGLSKSVNHHKSDWHEVASPIRHAVTLLCETLHEQMAGMQRLESELARVRVQVGSTEHSQAALEATVQGQLDACVHHVEKRLFKAAQAKVARDELEGCIAAVRDRVEHIVSEGLASTVGPLQEQLKTDSQHSAQLCVRLDALDAQHKKLALRVARHQKHIGASELAVEQLQSRMAGAEEAAVRTGDAASAAQTCAVDVGRQWDAATHEHAQLRQRLDQLATSTEEQIREAAASASTRFQAIELRTAVFGNEEQRLEEKVGAIVAGQERLERDMQAGQERLEKKTRAGQERLERDMRAWQERSGKETRIGREELEVRIKGLEDVGGRVPGLEQTVEDAASASGVALEGLREHVRLLESQTAKDVDKQAARLKTLEASVSSTPRLIQEANEAAVAGLVAQVSSLGRAVEEATSRAGRADDRAREALGAGSQNQTAIAGLGSTVTQLTRQVESMEHKAEEAQGRLDALEAKQHKLTLSVHTAVAEQMAHVPTTTHVERLLADQGEQLAASVRAAQEVTRAEGTRVNEELRQLQERHNALHKLTDQLKAGFAEAVTPAALDAALASLAAPLSKELKEERTASSLVAQRVSDLEGRLQQQLEQLRKDGAQLKTEVAAAVTPAGLEAALVKATASLRKGIEEESTISADLTQRLGSLESKLVAVLGDVEAVRRDTVQTVETRVSAAQSVSERQAAELVNAQVASLREQLAALTTRLTEEVSGMRDGLQEQIDHRCQELSANCRARAAEQATQLAEQAKQMEPALLKLTQQMEGIQRLCRQELQSVRVALESKASTDQMMELKTVLSEVDKLRSQVNSGTSTPRRSVVGSTLRPTTWKT